MVAVITLVVTIAVMVVALLADGCDRSGGDGGNKIVAVVVMTACVGGGDGSHLKNVLLFNINFPIRYI